MKSRREKREVSKKMRSEEGREKIGEKKGQGERTFGEGNERGREKTKESGGNNVMTSGKERGKANLRGRHVENRKQRSKREKIIGRERVGRKKWKDLSKKDPRIPTMTLGLSGHFLAPEP